MPVTPSSRRDAIRARVRRFTRRRRRAIAAVLAALGVFAAVSSLRAPSPASTQERRGSPIAAALAPGEAAVPIVLPSSGLVRSISPGEVVDLVRVPQDDSAEASILVRGARILQIPDGGSAFSGSSAAVVVVAVAAGDVLPLVTTSSRDTVGLVIRGFPGSR